MHLDVALRRGAALASIGEGAMRAGGNLFALLGADGAVELLCAANALLTGPDTYRLSGFLRGLAGSEAAAGRVSPAGSLIVRLDDGAVTPLIDRDAGGRPRLPLPDRACGQRSGRSGLHRDHRHGRPRGAHAAAAGPPAGAARRGWRAALLDPPGRRDGDAWEPAEIPLDEPEAYAVTLFSAAGTALRTLRAEAQHCIYADEAADFGGAQAHLDVAVAQIGQVAGPGPACRARIPVRTA